MPASERSSSEYSASALELDRQADEFDQEIQNLNDQAAVFLAKAKAAKEKAQLIRQQARDGREAANRRLFHEISLEKQMAFRREMADEVLTRVAVTLQTKEDLGWLKPIAEGNTSHCDVNVFKSSLWDAVAGDDPDFLATSARKVYNRYGRTITDDNLDALRVSNVCLATNHTLREQRESLKADQVAEQPVHGSEEPQEASNSHDSPNESSEALTQDHNAVGTNGSGMHLNNQKEGATSKADSAAENFIKAESVEQEGNQPKNRRYHMEDLNRDSEACDAHQHGEGRILATPVDFLEQDVQPANVPIGSIEPTNSSTQKSPSIVTPKMKRAREEDTMSTTEGGSGSAKKAKASVPSTPDKSPAAKFRKHIVDLARNGRLRASDLYCSKCQKTTQKPRVTAKCQHLYCNPCLNALRGSIRGKTELAKVRCCHPGCGSATGSGQTISQETIDELMQTYQQHLVDESGEEEANSDNSDEEHEEVYCTRMSMGWNEVPI